MYMDGSPVFERDHVFDVVYGAGIVQKVMGLENRFIVDYGNRSISYRQNGSGPWTARTLYWHNPVAGAPPKNMAAYGFYRELCLCLSQFCKEQTGLVNKLLESNNGA